MLTYEQALAQLLAAAQPVEEIRRVPLTAAAGRVLASAQQSGVAVPPLANSAMDGYAVRCADIGTAGDRALIKAMVFSRLLFPCAKLALKDQARGTLLASACGLSPEESFDEDDLYAAMDTITGNWCALEKGLAAGDRVVVSGLQRIRPGAVVQPQEQTALNN